MVEVTAAFPRCQRPRLAGAGRAGIVVVTDRFPKMSAHAPGRRSPSWDGCGHWPLSQDVGARAWQAQTAQRKRTHLIGCMIIHTSGRYPNMLAGFLQAFSHIYSQCPSMPLQTSWFSCLAFSWLSFLRSICLAALVLLTFHDYPLWAALCYSLNFVRPKVLVPDLPVLLCSSSLANPNHVDTVLFPHLCTPNLGFLCCPPDFARTHFPVLPCPCRLIHDASLTFHCRPILTFCTAHPFFAYPVLFPFF